MQLPISITLLYPLIEIYAIIVILRGMLQYLDADFNHPISQMIHRLTSLPIKILRKVVPRVYGSDLLSPLVLALVLVGAERYLLAISERWEINISALIFLSFARILDYAVFILIITILIRVVLSWVTSSIGNFHRLIISFTEPVMAPVRRLLPTFGGLDFSPIVVLILLELVEWIGVGFLEAIASGLLGR